MKKKSHKRMQMGGMAKMDDAAGRAMMKDLRGSRGEPMSMKSMASKGRASMMQGLPGGRGAPVVKKAPIMTTTAPVANTAVISGAPTSGITPVSTTTLPIAGRGAAAPGNTDAMKASLMTGMKKGGAVKSKKMRGGGLARKGVGMALAKGGMVKANGCAQRGKTRGKMV
jgi:hypothetical protein